MVSVNTVEKYIDLYTVYKKSRQETRTLEYCLTQLEHNLVEEDLCKLVSVLHKSELERVCRRVKSRGIPDLPWEVKEAA